LLDVGTGSGAILISLLKELPGWQGIGMDISPAALKVAQRNLAAHQLTERGQLLEGDLAALPERHFELIVSNPPYVSTAQWLELMPEVRDYEPSLALLGGADGLDCYRKLVAQADVCLSPGGWLLVEIGADQGNAVSELFKAAGLSELFLRHDYGQNPRVVGGRRNR
jgi:release factor glutamine methyltransferase